MPIATTEEMIEQRARRLPELPAARAERFERELGLSAERARLLAFRGELGDFFERALRAGAPRPAPGRLGRRRAGGRLGDQDPATSALEPAALGALVGWSPARTLPRPPRARC